MRVEARDLVNLNGMEGPEIAKHPWAGMLEPLVRRVGGKDAGGRVQFGSDAGMPLRLRKMTHDLQSPQFRKPVAP
jgi:hypothetical protein